MATVATRPTRVGDLIKNEFGLDHGYERVRKALVVASTAQIGTVYANDGTITVAADVASLATNGTTPLFILIDDAVYTDGHANGATVTYACLKGGPGASGHAIVTREQLKFGDTLNSGQIDTVVSVLNSQGIKVVTQV